MGHLCGVGAWKAAACLMAMFFALRPAAADEVKTDAGVVEGTKVETPGVRVFRGIPFAAAPVGDLRWKAPQPAAHWDGVRMADQFGSRCMQGVGGRAQGDGVWSTLHAGAHLFGHDFPRQNRQAGERGLPVSECVDACKIRTGSSGGDGVVLRRRVPGGVQFRTAV